MMRAPRWESRGEPTWTDHVVERPIVPSYWRKPPNIQNWHSFSVPDLASHKSISPRRAPKLSELQDGSAERSSLLQERWRTRRQKRPPRSGGATSRRRTRGREAGRPLAVARHEEVAEAQLERAPVPDVAGVGRRADHAGWTHRCGRRRPPPQRGGWPSSGAARVFGAISA
ncbi:unnamed protein product [Prorocentrum cordatum]|uniref:Uncharacterized protein n=1 Tax=Prorocentrum cordatum TaxID=2364126 RepID=A0ABN9Y9U5_9DINO|nr:unnamed protein product [Polarella glacialis]